MSCGGAQQSKAKPEPEIDPGFVNCLKKNVSPAGEHFGPIQWMGKSKYGLLDMWGGPWTKCGLRLLIRIDTPRGLYVRTAKEFVVRIQLHERPPSRAIRCSLDNERRYYRIDEYTVRCGPVGQIFLFFPENVDTEVTRAVLKRKKEACSAGGITGYLYYTTLEAEPVSELAEFDIMPIAGEIYRGWNRYDAPTVCEDYWSGEFG